MASASPSAIERLPPGQHRYPDYGGNPLAHILSNVESERLPAFGGAFQPGLYKPPAFKFGNPVPLGLSGFALTTFVLNLINLGVRDITSPALVIAPALVYGGFIQLLAGMWDIALGNVFGGTALSTYGGFWISLAILLIPGGFGIEKSYASQGDFYAAFGLYIFGWMIVTIMFWLCTLRSTIFFSSLFCTVWLSFLCLGISYLDAQNNAEGLPNLAWQKAGGGLGIIAAFLAWYNMLAGLLDPGNSFFLVPVFHFPWSEKGRSDRMKAKQDGNGESV
ncbi:Accumulation of DYads [Recurvomyces mirabilis]|uniref:Accumulation of DYads n=1 Tax=Recurvomyces mirabilis TaxID=574656 RepID=A0AAE0WVA5_9PEZI|nr:Accumulation of DYads [Recurvomyces mirabilis]KAK5156670.1 Accumulation of DYads [Recurvomyces mirabilis]